MARKPRRPAERGRARPGKAARSTRRGVSALAIVVFLLVAGAGAGIAWLSLTYEPPPRVGMPGNELVVALDDAPAAETTTAEASERATDQAAAPPADAPASDPATDDTAPPPAADGSGAAPAVPDQSPPTAMADQAAPPTTAEQATPAPAADQVQPPAPPGEAPTPATDPAAAPAVPEQTTAPAESQQHAAVPPGTDHVGAPPPAGVPQRQPVGEQQAMQLKVPPPAPGVRPRIAVVLTGLGLSKAQTTAAIQALPANITFAFSPYGSDLQDWADQSRAAGHEVLLELPMEPLGFPSDDPGPHTLLTSLTVAENVERMTWVLDRFTGYVGVTSQLGSRFTTQADALRPILAELKKRGLLFLDTRASPDTVAPELAAEAGLAHAMNDVFLTEPTAARATVQAGLAELERLARERGSAIGVGHPFPVTMEMLSTWARGIDERGIELLPLSALARLPEAQ